MEGNDFLGSKLDRVIGPKTAAAFTSAFGYQLAEDLLTHYPRRYIRRGELTDIDQIPVGSEATILAEVLSTKVRKIPGRKGAILETVVTDGRAKLTLTFFNQAWREKELRTGRQGLFAGKISLFNGKRQLAHPEYQLIPEGDDVDGAIDQFAGKLIPIYPASGKLPSWKIQQSISLVLDTLGEILDPLPEEFRELFQYPSKRDAFINVHRPESIESAERALARLTFDEALLLQLILIRKKNKLKKAISKKRVAKSDGILSKFDQSLPFTLTEGQQRISDEIESDLKSENPMYRLLQGEVGSGKTVLAIRAMLSVVDSGGQAALLAPTEVLAQQHFRNLSKSLAPFLDTLNFTEDPTSTQRISIALLTGSLSSREKEEIRGRIKRHEVDLVIGTHALIEESVTFKDLGIVVVDEQHRFGVEQRDALRNRSQTPPHILVMTATPIPRTVAMTVFGDLDLSILDQLPTGRSPITTHLIPVLEKPHFLDRAWERIKEEVAKGHQGYVVAPRISSSDSLSEVTFSLSSDIAERAARLLGEEGGEREESEKTMASVEEFYPMLSNGPLSNLRISPLHGRMSMEEKDQIMNSFAEGAIDLLVATTVIEVGIDVANATVMVILDADRFGVSQLHQLRGRVGRGASPGLCLLVSRAGPGTAALTRLEAVAATLDGFELSRIDLEQRREGDVLGQAQSGTRSHLRLLRVLRDEEMIVKARELAIALLERDNDLTNHPALAAAVNELELESQIEFMEKG
jgi:ATP-dependent DNA helicase RecG